MKEIGIKLNGEDISLMYSMAKGKINTTTQELMLSNEDVENYKPFIRLNGEELPINYNRVISHTTERNRTVITEFKNGKEGITNIHESPSFKTILFIIEEI